jgi:hypothetical protein
MKTFKEIHAELIERAEKANACNKELTKLKTSTTIEEIIEIFKNNVNFLSQKMRLNAQNIIGIVDKSLLGELLTGVDNIGFWNTRDWNTGDRNTGNRNTGDWNTGDRNTGNRNTGNRNTGDWNTGDRNTGDRNTGNWNTGNRNTGNRNTGNRNTGDWNTGDRNTGFFNRDTPKLRFFEKDSDWTCQDWYNSKAHSASCKFILTEWIPESEMTDKEKIEQPLFHTQEGYLRKYEYKQACEIWWSKLKQDEKDSFKELPNFSSEIFKDITGIDI